MNIYINEIKSDYQPLPAITWGKFFQDLLHTEIKKGHGIVKILVNKVSSPEVMNIKTEETISENIDTIEIFTKDSYAISEDGMSKMSVLIESIKEELTKTADCYRDGDIKKASEKIIAIMEALKPMVNFINSVGMNFTMNFDQIKFNEQISLRQKIESFLTTFQDLIMAQQKKDYIEIADYLEYELSSDMNDWHKIVELLKQEIKASTNAPN
jgi:prophage DNA circulation protein